jgi:hypothetical protein
MVWVAGGSWAGDPGHRFSAPRFLLLSDARPGMSDHSTVRFSMTHASLGHPATSTLFGRTMAMLPSLVSGRAPAG